MPLVKRITKGSPLTYAEGDGNLDFLDNKAQQGIDDAEDAKNLANATGALNASLITQDATHRFWTDTEKALNTASLAALAQASRLRRGSFANKSVVTFGSRMPFAGVLSDGVLTTQTSKLRHKAIGNIGDLQLYFVNFANIQAVSASVQDDITIEASIEYPAGTFTRVTFNKGNNSFLLRKSLSVLSDYVPVEIPKDAFFWVRTNVLVTSGQKWLTTGAVGSGNTFEGFVDNVNSVMSGTIGTPGSSTYVYTSSLVLGVSDTGQAAIYCFGDSISQGTNDAAGTNYGFQWSYGNGGGLYGRAFQDKFPLLKVNVAGQKISDWVNATSINYKYYGEVLSSGQFAISNLGINDLGAGGTLATIRANYLLVWGTQKARGIRCTQTTISPRTTSTDGWTTTANQTVYAFESIRVAINDWLRDGAPINFTAYTPANVGDSGVDVIRIGSVKHPLVAYFEVADALESARNSGKWKPGYTTEGLHPEAVGYAAAYLAIDTTIFTV